MDITKFSIERNRFTYAVLFILIVSGLYLFNTLRRAENPDFTVRIASVKTIYPGASADKVEELVTEKIENIIKEIPELDYIKSESYEGLSVVLVNIQEDIKTLQPVWDNLRRKIERVRPALPENVKGPFVNDEFGDVFGIIIGVSGDNYSYEELKEVSKILRDDLYKLSDAGKVQIHGIQQERFYIEYNKERLSKFNISPLQLRGMLKSTNIIIPSGSFNFDNNRVYLETSGNFTSIEQIKKVCLQLPGSKNIIYLEDVVDIHRDYVDPPQKKVRINGKEGLGVAVSLSAEGNIIKLGKQIDKLLAGYNQKFPEGIDFEIVAYEHIIADEKVNEFVGNLVQSIVVVILIMFAFLGIRTGLIVASLIPSTIIITFVFMSFFDIGLDKVSLAALIIALGMLVDNAIVMSELIMVKMENKRSPFTSAIEAAKELKIPLLTSTLTTSVAFLPIYLAEAMAGEMLSSLFMVVSITLLTSWILALTLIPLLCVYFIKTKKTERKNLSDSITGFVKVYEKILLKYLKKPAKLFVPLILLFVLSIVMIRLFVPQIYFPPSDRNLISARIILANGTDISQTETVIKEVEQYLKDSLLVNERRQEGILNWASFIGGGAPRYTLNYNPDPPDSKLAYILINTSSGDNTDYIAGKLTKYCQRSFPGIIADINKIPLGPPMKFKIEFRIQGQETFLTSNALKDAKAKLKTIPGVQNVTDDWGIKTPKIFVKIDQLKARSAGITNADIAQSLQSISTGIVTSSFRDKDDIIPIVLRQNPGSTKNISQLELVNIFSQKTGKNIPLSQIADLEIDWRPPIINRRDGEKTYTIQAGVLEGYNAKKIVNEMTIWLDQYFNNLGDDYNYEIGGEIENSTNAQNAIKAKVPLAVLSILLLLIGQFNSIRKSVIILLTIPLALTGVAFGLIILDSYMGFMTFLGIISLGGIVVNNAIVMLDRFQTEKTVNKKTDARAIIDACKSRFRPIILTTATTSFGVLPLLLGGGLLFESMAIAIMFGLIFSTVITLIFVPVSYKVFFNINFSGVFENQKNLK